MAKFIVAGSIFVRGDHKGRPYNPLVLFKKKDAGGASEGWGECDWAGRDSRPEFFKVADDLTYDTLAAADSVIQDEKISYFCSQ